MFGCRTYSHSVLLDLLHLYCCILFYNSIHHGIVARYMYVPVTHLYKTYTKLVNHYGAKWILNEKKSHIDLI